MIATTSGSQSNLSKILHPGGTKFSPTALWKQNVPISYSSHRKEKKENKNKTIVVSPNVSIITITVNWTHQSKGKISGMNSKQDTTICCLQVTHLSSKDKQAQSKRVEDDSPSKWHPEENRCSHTYITQNRFQDQKINKTKVDIWWLKRLFIKKT